MSDTSTHPAHRSGTILTDLLSGLQGLWLLPQLELRVAAIIAGDSVEPSFHHDAYALVEAAKALLLLLLVVAARGREPAPFEVERGRSAAHATAFQSERQAAISGTIPCTFPDNRECRRANRHATCTSIAKQ